MPHKATALAFPVLDPFAISFLTGFRTLLRTGLEHHARHPPRPLPDAIIWDELLEVSGWRQLTLSSPVSKSGDRVLCGVNELMYGNKIENCNNKQINKNEINKVVLGAR